MPTTDSAAARTRSKAKAPTTAAKVAFSKREEVQRRDFPHKSDKEPLPSQRSSKKRKREEPQTKSVPSPKTAENRKKERWDSFEKILSEESKMNLSEKTIDALAEMRAEGKAEKERKINAAGTDKEKRLRSTRSSAPKSYLQKLDRALSQRMFVLSRTRSGTDTVPEETVEMAGTTGNVYHITIGLEPSCTCPDNKKGNQCKHIVYVLYNVLKAPENLRYQLAFLSAELREIFEQAPEIPASQSSSSSKDAPSVPADEEQEDKNRKPIEGDCPICYTEFSPSSEEIIYCKAACGNNVHKECFDQWAHTIARGEQVRCVYCRTPWQRDKGELMESIKKGGGEMNEEGYINVGAQLGLRPVRAVGEATK
ncbi:MAG: hypothetical protein Q9218_003572 [Villophora microphyllina]